MTVKLKFLWFDLWMGAYWDRAKQILYVCPLPCVVLIFEFTGKPSTLPCKIGIHDWESDSDNIEGQCNGIFTIVWWSCKRCGEGKVKFIGR